MAGYNLTAQGFSRMKDPAAIFTNILDTILDSCEVQLGVLPAVYLAAFQGAIDVARGSSAGKPCVWRC